MTRSLFRRTARVGFFAIVLTAMLVTTSVPNRTACARDIDCFVRLESMCCLDVPEYLALCPNSAEGFCWGDDDDGANDTIWKREPAGAQSGWTHDRFTVDTVVLYRCIFFPPICSDLTPDGCSVDYSRRIRVYCQSWLPATGLKNCQLSETP